MASNDNVSMAVFCDFENVALGVRDANYDKFDIKPILERLLLKGSIVVKKAYCDWDRYKSFKATMHEANFELIEIPHVRQSGKNSADIRLVVDALDLCYTKSHVNTFVIISGDSDFSPLVSKLRENAKQVIGVGVKQSTSDLLIANCDEFIFYDDLVRESRRAQARRDTRGSAPAAQTDKPKRTPDEEKQRREEMDARRTQAIDMAVETFEALSSERGDSGKVWASRLKDAIKRRKPDFSESYYGFRSFGNLLEEAQARGLLEFGRDEKSGAYVYRSSAPASLIDAERGATQAQEAPVAHEAVREAVHATDTDPDSDEDAIADREAWEAVNGAGEQTRHGGGDNGGGAGSRRESRRGGRGGRKSGRSDYRDKPAPMAAKETAPPMPARERGRRTNTAAERAAPAAAPAHETSSASPMHEGQARDGAAVDTSVHGAVGAESGAAASTTRGGARGGRKPASAKAADGAQAMPVASSDATAVLGDEAKPAAKKARGTGAAKAAKDPLKESASKARGAASKAASAETAQVQAEAPAAAPAKAAKAAPKKAAKPAATSTRRPRKSEGAAD
ncbi:MAG: NYN domain-containing protein [Pseudomonadota bacterium]